MSESFWKKIRLVTHILFDLCLFKHFSPVANFGNQSLGTRQYLVVKFLSSTGWSLSAWSLSIIAKCQNLGRFSDLPKSIWQRYWKMGFISIFSFVWRIWKRAKWFNLQRPGIWTLDFTTICVNFGKCEEKLLKFYWWKN